MVKQRTTPRRAVALQQSWMEKAETILTVKDCHPCCREDTKSSMPDGVTCIRSKLPACIATKYQRTTSQNNNQRGCWCEPSKHQMASWKNESVAHKGKWRYSPGREGLLPRAAPRQRAAPVLPTAAAYCSAASKSGRSAALPQTKKKRKKCIIHEIKRKSLREV